ncbi:MAG TPA: LPS export ABC transporter permease LptG [Hyphomicrobiaceae bacterium]|nr:LPS export ABC transporter permease LptG [Hyphomicrobiaceae bacterium]
MTAASILTRYLLRRFLAAILATFAVCSLLVFMIDFVEMLRQSGKYGSVPFSTLIWLTALRLPAYTELMLAFAVQVGSIAALLVLNRRSELAVMRSAGMSVWQFLRPALALSLALGTFAVAVYNPLAAAARAESERLFAEVFGRESNFLQTGGSGAWLRQEGADGSSVVNAAGVTNRGMQLVSVMFLLFDRDGRFQERIDGDRASLRDGFWQVENALVSRPHEQPERYPTYLVSTYLSHERIQDALGSTISVSFWELPGLIEATERAGISPYRFQIQYELLWSRPALLAAMVLLGATVSLRSFRTGSINTMVISGMIGGLGFLLLAEVSRQVGVAGLISPRAAVWVPVAGAILVSLTVLLHQEDG